MEGLGSRVCGLRHCGQSGEGMGTDVSEAIRAELEERERGEGVQLVLDCCHLVVDQVELRKACQACSSRRVVTWQEVCVREREAVVGKAQSKSTCNGWAGRPDHGGLAILGCH